MKKNNRYLVALCVFLTIFSISCSKEFDEHYNPSNRIDKNIVQILAEDQEFSEFVKLIDKLGLRKTLGESAIYTCLAPKNDQVLEYFKNKGYASIDVVPEIILRQFVNSHFINGMYYKYDIEKRYKDAVGGLNPTKATYYTTRAENLIPAKSIRIFTPSFFNLQQDDYKTLFNQSGGGFMVETAKISDTKYDIDASNGVIHVLETPLTIQPRMDLAIAADPQISIFNSWLNAHVTYVLGPKDEFGRVDTTLYKSYSLSRNIASESVLSTFFAPTNEVVMSYFQPYLPDLYNTIDSLPKIIKTEILRATLLGDTWYKSDIVRNNPELRTTTYPQIIGKIGPTIVGSVPASNGIIYKVNKFIEPPKLHSVEGGVYMKKRIYGQWNVMFEKTTLEDGLTDGLLYQHSDKTILVQPDASWGFPLAEDMDVDALALRMQQCRTGILNIDVRKDGGLRRRYYPTEFGYILFENGKFIDYTGKSVSLLKTQSTWERINGSIFEIDGFLTPMNKLDLTRTVYALVEKDTQLSLFKDALIKSGLTGELNLTGFFTYTILAPPNTAIQAAGISVPAMTADQAKTFVSKYIIPNRYVFTDGVFQGNVPDKAGNFITIAGAWENFKATNVSGKTVSPTTANLQGSNGVVHKINQVF
ncbi:fasciclin domain-containing protein [Pedobacter frigiditerrae]|uniref:fasciclin domain-containing protein n=1 Tax=Pedobacter frigiditerrae TaxID=2530452 RepID=UPI00292EFB17|nr:fasciclin domain-containing protein [Pedobacter frigiditerrae]